MKKTECPISNTENSGGSTFSCASSPISDCHENSGFPGATYGRDSGMKTTQEYPISKWAVTRMGVPVLSGTEMKSSRGTRDLLKWHRVAIPPLVIDHSVLDIGYSVMDRVTASFCVFCAFLRLIKTYE